MRPAGSRRAAPVPQKRRSPQIPYRELRLRIFTSEEPGTVGVLSWTAGRTNTTEAATEELLRVVWPGRMDLPQHGLWCVHDLMRQYYEATRPARPRDPASPHRTDIT